MIPSCKVGHIGLYRDPETLEPVEYYCKLPPDVSERDVIVVDPMFATGGSASAAMHVPQAARLHVTSSSCASSARLRRGRRCRRIIRTSTSTSPRMDPILNDHGYIVPGLGDAGDRIFGTK